MLVVARTPNDTGSLVNNGTAMDIGAKVDAAAIKIYVVAVMDTGAAGDTSQ